MRQLPSPMYLSQHSKRRLVFCFALALLLVLAIVYGAFWWFPKHMPKWWPRWLGGRSSKHVATSSSSSSSYVSIEPKKKPIKKKHVKRGEHSVVGFEGLDDLESVRRKSMKSVDKLQDALNGRATSRPMRRRAKKSTLVSFLGPSSTVSTNSASEERRFPKKYRNSKIFCGRRMDQWVYKLHDKVKELVLQYGRNIGREYFENIETFWHDVRPKRELLLSKKQKKIVAKKIEAGAKELVKSMAKEKKPSKQAIISLRSSNSRKTVKPLKKRRQSGKYVTILPQPSDSRKARKSLKESKGKRKSTKRTAIVSQSSESSNEESTEGDSRKVTTFLKKKKPSNKRAIIVSQSAESSEFNNEESTKANSKKVTAFLKNKKLSNKHATILSQSSESTEPTESVESTELSDSTGSTESSTEEPTKTNSRRAVKSLKGKRQSSKHTKSLSESLESTESTEADFGEMQKSLKEKKKPKKHATILPQSPESVNSRKTGKSLKGKKRSEKQAIIVSTPSRKRNPSDRHAKIVSQSSESTSVSEESQSSKQSAPNRAIKATKIAPTSTKNTSRYRKKTFHTIAPEAKKVTVKLPSSNLSEDGSVSGDWKESLENGATKIPPLIQSAPSSPQSQVIQFETKAPAQDTARLATNHTLRKEAVGLATKHSARKDIAGSATEHPLRKETTLTQNAIRTVNLAPTTANVKASSALLNYDSSDDTVVKPAVIPTRRSRTTRSAATPASSNIANNRLFGGKYNLIDMS